MFVQYVYVQEEHPNLADLILLFACFDLKHLMCGVASLGIVWDLWVISLPQCLLFVI